MVNFTVLLGKDKETVLANRNYTQQPEVGFLNSEELGLIKSSPLPAQLPGLGRS